MLLRRRDHARRHIDTDHWDTLRGEVGGHLSRPTAKINHHAKALNTLREVVEHVAVEGLAVEFVAESIRVRARNRVIPRAGPVNRPEVVPVSRCPRHGLTPCARLHVDVAVSRPSSSVWSSSSSHMSSTSSDRSSRASSSIAEPLGSAES